MSRFVVTGANGFVGQALCAELINRGYFVRAVVRAIPDLSLRSNETIRISDIATNVGWKNILHGMTTVIHLAARVHVMQDDATDPLEEFRRANVAGTEYLARAAIANGVKRLVYVSSIKVNGEMTQVDDMFTEADKPVPQDPYGISKWEAEQILHRIAEETGLEVVIVRPPLVYGGNVKGNFAKMLGVLRKGIPLPLASVQNLRSLIYVGNLVDALILCAMHSDAAGETYLVSDNADVSTSDLLRELGNATGCPARLLPCPPGLLKLGAAVFGKSEQVERLIGSLRVDTGKIRNELGWLPPYSLLQGLQATVR